MPKVTPAFKQALLALLEILMGQIEKVGVNGRSDPVAFQCVGGLYRLAHELICGKPSKKKSETEILSELLASLKEVVDAEVTMELDEMQSLITRAEADRATAQAVDTKVELPEDENFTGPYLAALRAGDMHTAHVIMTAFLAKHNVEKPSKEVAKSETTQNYIEKFRTAVVDMITAAVTRAVGDVPAHDVSSALTMALSPACNPTIKTTRRKKAPAEDDAKRGAVSHESDDEDDAPPAKRPTGKKRAPPPPQNQLDQAGLLSDSDDE